jgi:hypothetical protein
MMLWILFNVPVSSHDVVSETHPVDNVLIVVKEATVAFRIAVRDASFKQLID